MYGFSLGLKFHFQFELHISLKIIIQNLRKVIKNRFLRQLFLLTNVAVVRRTRLIPAEGLDTTAC